MSNYIWFVDVVVCSSCILLICPTNMENAQTFKPKPISDLFSIKLKKYERKKKVAIAIIECKSLKGP